MAARRSGSAIGRKAGPAVIRTAPGRRCRPAARRVAAFDGEDAGFVGGQQDLPRPAADRPELDAPGALAAQRAADVAQALVAQEALGEGGVLRADVGEAAEQARAAEQLALPAGRAARRGAAGR